jgi:hypothetical protein
MLDSPVPRGPIAGAPDRLTGPIGGLIPFGGDETENRNEVGNSSVSDLLGDDQATSDLTISEDLLSDITDASPTEIPITAAVTPAAFLVTNWLVGEGER